MYLFWTYKLSDATDPPGWFGQTTQWAVLLILVLVGMLVGVACRKLLLVRLVFMVLPLSFTLMTYAGTSFNLYDSHRSKVYIVYRGAVYVPDSFWITPPPNNRFDFFATYGDRPPGNEYRFSLWILNLILLGLCFAPEARQVVTVVRSRRRANRGLCGKCGYDLTGNTSRVCPECGTAVHAPATENDAGNP